LFVPPDRQAAVKQQLDRLVHVPFRFEQNGSQIMLFDPDQDYHDAEVERTTRPIDAFRELQITKAA
jgi:D-glycero-alpha-D-manno-heptose-7-phosphate kinase